MKKTIFGKALMILNTFFLMVLFSFVSSDKKSAVQKENVNILLIVSEDNGPELGCYGITDVKTPVLDDLASRGVRFENAFVTYSVCSPSRSTIFTGMYPHQNGQIGLATHKYHMFPGLKTLPVFLKEAGYRTGCLGKIHVNPETTIPFDFHPIKSSNFNRKDLWQYEAFSDSFFRQSSQPFFMMVNYPDAHFPLIKQAEGMPANPIGAEDVSGPLPFIGADSYRLRSYTADYYNCMNRLDQMVGNLLRKLKESGKADNTLIIYLGDHGAQFSRAKGSCYDAGIKIPLIIYWPGKTKAGLVKKELVSSIDLLPTILEAAGIQTPSDLTGKSWVRLIQGKDEQNERAFIFSESDGSAPRLYHPQRSIRNTQYKLIRNLIPGHEDPHFISYANHINPHFDGGTEIKEIEEAPSNIQKAYNVYRNPPEFELYDLKSDPYEFNNLAQDPSLKSTLELLKKELKKWQEKTADPLADKSVLTKMTNEINEINEKYPNQEYTRDPEFKWKYPDYFSAYWKSRKNK